MKCFVETFTVNKRHALRISRGTTTRTTNLWLRLEDDGIEGWGEASPFSVTHEPLGTARQRGRKLTRHPPQTTEQLQKELEAIAPLLLPYSPWQRQEIEQLLLDQAVPSGVRTAIDIALYDWMGKVVGQPLWKLWGLECDRISPISVTIGISTPEQAQDRLRAWQKLLPVELIKLKLGNPQGISADQAMFTAVQQIAPRNSRIYVDANGGWSLEDAAVMAEWLAGQGVAYIEQPLAKGQEDDLLKLKAKSPLPIFIDESCWGTEDILRYRDRIDGINIKLMKSGGLTEAMRMVQTARACGLQVMLGCYSDSCLLNTAAAHLSPLADYLDLDSHLNLLDDPFEGAKLQDSRVVPNDLPGLGVTRQQAL
ncbi:MAG: dipeptide epimerase [Synechococcales cyanobacterium CRU_2_2]|nr:dipeptide epimerase [Synechococcales cyanobacterium CRU_2_2]